MKSLIYCSLLMGGIVSTVVAANNQDTEPQQNPQAQQRNNQGRGFPRLSHKTGSPTIQNQPAQIRPKSVTTGTTLFSNLATSPQDRGNRIYGSNFGGGPASNAIPFGNVGSQRDPYQPKVDAKIREFKMADSDSDRDQIVEQIRELLNQQFDHRLKVPGDRIESLTKRIDELEKQMRKREQNADAIVDLQLNVMTNEADGLGWNPGRHSGSLFSTLPMTIGNPNPYRNQPYYYPTPQTTVPLATNPVVYPPGAVPRPVTPVPNFDSTQPAGVPGNNQAGINRYAPNTPTSTAKPKDGVSQRQLLQDWSKSDDEKERSKIKAELRKGLVKQFDQNQAAFGRQLELIRKQVDELKDNVSQRKSAKNSIVDLKLKTLINQAKGLGF